MGDFSQKFFPEFFMGTLQRGLSPLFTRQNVTYGRGDTGEGGVHPPIPLHKGISPPVMLGDVIRSLPPSNVI